MGRNSSPHVTVSIVAASSGWYLTVRQSFWRRGREHSSVPVLVRPIGRHDSLRDAIDAALPVLEDVRDRLPG